MTPPNKQADSGPPPSAAPEEKRRGDALAAALAKVNHDLRNALATATLAGPRITVGADPLLQSVLHRLTEGMEHAVELCSEAIAFAEADAPAQAPTRFALHALVSEVGGKLTAEFKNTRWIDTLDPALEIEAERDRMSILLAELGRNALENGAREVRIDARTTPHKIFIGITDDGPGLAPRARAKLFTPILSAARPGRSGLGLVLARNIARAKRRSASRIVRRGRNGFHDRSAEAFGRAPLIAQGRALAARIDAAGQSVGSDADNMKPAGHIVDLDLVTHRFECRPEFGDRRFLLQFGGAVAVGEMG